ncbi:hypothetical protein MMC34_007999 [Xylographa carneopallida]|nr:hypothetical protein [Xylographa carneopallida]
MYEPTLALVFLLALLSFFSPTTAELHPRQAGANGATAQLSLLSTTGPSSSTFTSTTATGSMTMSSSVPASVSAAMASASASVAESAAASIATNAATGGGGGSGAQGIGGASNGAVGRGEGGMWWVGGVVGLVMGGGYVV